jgi:hypothetical protein
MTKDLPEVLYVNQDEEGNLAAYSKEFEAVDDEGEWQTIGIYKLAEKVRVRKILEQKTG